MTKRELFGVGTMEMTNKSGRVVKMNFLYKSDGTIMTREERDELIAKTDALYSGEFDEQIDIANEEVQARRNEKLN